MSDATTELVRALRMSANIGTFGLEDAVSRTWASATFTGVRHRIAFRLEGEGAHAAAEAFLAGLADAEFHLRGHFLADIALLSRASDGDAVRIAIEALTIEAD